MTNPLDIMLMISVYDNSNIGPSSVVYIFHKSIIPCFFILSESTPLICSPRITDQLFPLHMIIQKKAKVPYFLRLSTMGPCQVLLSNLFRVVLRANPH